MKSEDAGSVTLRVPAKRTESATSLPRTVQPTVRICMVEAHALVRVSIRRLLIQEPDLAVIAECSSVGEALEALRTTPCDLVLLELDLEPEWGASLLPELEAMKFPGRVLVLADAVDDDEAVRLLSRGVTGILLKENSPERLISAVRRVMAGEFSFDPHYVQLFMWRAAQLLKKEQHLEFTARERVLARMLMEGFSNKEIATRLELSAGATAAAIHRLFARAGARNRSQFVRTMLQDCRGVLHAPIEQGERALARARAVGR